MLSNPYVVGQWVRGEKFYGREALINSILTGNRNCLWLLGTRRIGKTSLLKQVEMVASRDPRTGYFPIFWDFQGAETQEDLHEGFADAVMDAEDRLEECGLSSGEIEADDLFTSLRKLRRALRTKKLKPLLLCDEVEELIGLNQQDPFLLKKLRRAMQSHDDIRTVLASKIKLWQLSREKADTSPFLEGFTPPLYVQPLEDDEARALIRQVNLPSDSRPRLGEDEVEIVRERCNNHPYLIQLLCEKHMELRDLTASIDRLASDPMVSYFFSVDFELLTDAERRILHAVGERDTLTAGALQDELAATSATLDGSLYRLEHLGYIRRDEQDRFSLANYFFRIWFRDQPLSPAGGGGVAPSVSGLTSAEEIGGALEETNLGVLDGRYELLHRIGAGSMGIVYKARDLMLRENIALKILKAEYTTNSSHLERFRREILLGRDLEHPNILKTYHLGAFGDRHYLTMKLIEGPTLERLIRDESPLALERVVTIARQIAAALAAAHDKGVVHRDIKSENILIGPEGQPLLTDFGMARLQDRAAMTQSGVFMGTPYYASPEQADLLPANELSDQYSLGVVIYEMAAGGKPFIADSVQEVLQMHRKTPPPPLETVRSDASLELCGIVARCLEKQPEARFPSVHALANALAALEPA